MGVDSLFKGCWESRKAMLVILNKLFTWRDCQLRVQWQCVCHTAGWEV